MKFNRHFFKNILAVAILLSTLSSCKKYVEVDLGTNLVSRTDAYATDNSATSATLALYSYYPTVNSLQYETWLGGLSSDEMQYTGVDALFTQYAQNVISVDNSYSSSYIWSYSYQVIRECNLIINGVTTSTGVTAVTKSQLIGEAKFFRALMYFNLVNYFGGVPVLSSTVELNDAQNPRVSPAEIYAIVFADLKDAQNFLPATYAGTASLKLRVNKWAATALLAKVYLYNKDYVNAEAEATKVIGSGTYTMSALANTFINSSSETILQLGTLYGASAFTGFRTTSSAANVSPPAFVLYSSFTKDFELADNRKTSWIDSTTYNSVKYYRINKYKVQVATAAVTGNEYTVLLRLAEQYLIRAEARARLETDLKGAREDLNVIRRRAGLLDYQKETKNELLDAIEKERRIELNTEFGHRWFDLKRTQRVDVVMSAIKTNWTPSAALYPIPATELRNDPNLTQNIGY